VTSFRIYDEWRAFLSSAGAGPLYSEHALYGSYQNRQSDQVQSPTEWSSRAIYEDILEQTVGDLNGWSSGWSYVNDLRSGCIVEKYGVSFVVPRKYVIESEGDRSAKVGDAPYDVCVPRLNLNLSPGFAILNGRKTCDIEYKLRLYVNVDPQLAMARIGDVLKVLDSYTDQFILKIMTQPSEFGRADTMVAMLNLGPGMIERLVTNMLFLLDNSVRPTAPRLTFPIGKGAAIAKNPLLGESYGKHIARIVSKLANCDWANDHAIGLLFKALRESGFDPAEIWALGDQEFASEFRHIGA